MHEIVLQAPMGPEHGRSGVMSDEQPPVDESECIEHDKEWDVTAHTEEVWCAQEGALSVDHGRQHAYEKRNHLDDGEARLLASAGA